jgi:hypothetical protein
MIDTQVFDFRPGQVVRFRRSKNNDDQSYRVVGLTAAPDKLWTHFTQPPMVDAVVIETIDVGSYRYTVDVAVLLALDPEEVKPG